MIIEWMYSFVRSIGGFLVLMGLLVTIHEYGHFYVARKLGFKVLKFSIGFGKPLWRRMGKDNIEYIIGMIPLGGYVAMLDERVHEVAPEDLGKTFNAQALWKRTLVVAAGPAANVLLAIVLLWGLFIYGLPTYKPYIDAPQHNTPFFDAGFKKKDLIIAVDGHKIDTYEQLIYRLIEYLDDGVAEIELVRDGVSMTKRIDLGAPLSLNAKSMLNETLGVNLYFPDIPAKVGLVVANSPAEKGGVIAGDTILKVGAHTVQNWNDLLESMTNASMGETIVFTLLRGQQKLTLPIVPERDTQSQRLIIGVGIGELSDDIKASFKEIQTLQKLSILPALSYALKETYNSSQMIFKFMGRMVKGEIHINTMAGPISIANIAGKALESGIVFFIQLTALFSINIGMLNLLPLPVLDGGRLVGFMIEKIIGKNKVPERITVMVMQAGACFLIGFTLLVVFYDVTRWF